MSAVIPLYDSAYRGDAQKVYRQIQTDTDDVDLGPDGWTRGTAGISAVVDLTGQSCVLDVVCGSGGCALCRNNSIDVCEGKPTSPFRKRLDSWYCITHSSDSVLRQARSERMDHRQKSWPDRRATWASQCVAMLAISLGNCMAGHIGGSRVEPPGPSSSKRNSFLIASGEAAIRSRR